MKRFLVSITLIAVMTIGSYTQAATLWSEDFSDVSDWGIVYAQHYGSSISASGGLGRLYVDAPNSVAAFAPNTIDANLIPFDTTKKSEYTLNWIVDDLTYSISWDIALDEYDLSKTYISTSWGIYGTSTNEKGAFAQNLGSKTFNADTAYVKPKVTVHTGAVAQSVYLDNMSMDQNPIPEPTSILLLGSGLMGLFGISRKRK